MESSNNRDPLDYIMPSRVNWQKDDPEKAHAAQNPTPMMNVEIDQSDAQIAKGVTNNPRGVKTKFKRTGNEYESDPIYLQAALDFQEMRSQIDADIKVMSKEDLEMNFTTLNNTIAKHMMGTMKDKYSNSEQSRAVKKYQDMLMAEIQNREVKK